MKILILKNKKILTGWLFFLILIFSTKTSFASYNSYQFFIGDKASGMGGAFTAQANDPNALWYNPAGLALINKDQINFSASTYNFLKQERKGAIEVEFADGTESEMNVKENDFSIVPTSLAYSFKLSEGSKNNPVLGIGIFVPVSNSLQASLDESVSQNQEQMDIYSTFSRSNRLYILSTGVGVSVSQYLNLGIAGGIGYFSQNISQEWRHYYRNSGIANFTSFYSNHVNGESKSITATGTAGIQSQIGNNFLGVTYKLPHYKLYNDSKLEIFIDSYSSTAGINQHQRTTIEPDLYKNIPARLTAGYAYLYPNSFSFSLEVSHYFKKEDLAKNINNYHLGMEFFLTDTFIIRSGLFTDLSQEEGLTTTSIKTERLDYYGATLACSLLNETDQKKFWTSFGITYRLGKGEYRSTNFSPNGLTFENKDWTTHNFTLYFSESISF